MIRNYNLNKRFQQLISRKAAGGVVLHSKTEDTSACASTEAGEHSISHPGTQTQDWEARDTCLWRSPQGVQSPPSRHHPPRPDVYKFMLGVSLKACLLMPAFYV